MDLGKLCSKHSDLIHHIQNEGYSKDYIRRLKTEINWLRKNKGKINIQTYDNAYRIRQSHTKSSKMRRCYRLAYGILNRFDIYSEYPDRRQKY